VSLELLLRRLEAIKPLENAVLGPFGHRRHPVVFVLQRDVVVNVLVRLAEHAVDAIFDDHRELESERHVVRPAARHRRRVQQAVTVLVL
jgi:hypothetical protein